MAKTPGIWPYVVTHDRPDLGVEDLRFILDGSELITDWLLVFPTLFLIASPLPATAIAKELQPYFAPGGYIILDANTDRGGWLPKRAWNFCDKYRVG